MQISKCKMTVKNLKLIYPPKGDTKILIFDF